jgi:putative aldouronate transport system permease protein
MQGTRTTGEWIFTVANAAIMAFLLVVMLYPFLYVTFASISDPTLVMQHRGILMGPLGFSLASYRLVVRNPMILKGYVNTLIYVTAGTSLNLLMTSLGAYALSRKQWLGKKTLMLIIVFQLFFSGGLIPFFLLVKWLGMMNTRLAMIVPTAIISWHMFIMATAFRQIPEALEESAKIDGANDFTVLFRIFIPLSAPIVAVMVLFYGVNHWNEWFYAMVFLRKRELYPLQLILREILITSSTASMMTSVASLDKVPVGLTVKYATIVIATVPILFAYPFLQRYFVSGVMIGSLKGYRDNRHGAVLRCLRGRHEVLPQLFARSGGCER